MTTAVLIAGLTTAGVLIVTGIADALGADIYGWMKRAIAGTKRPSPVSSATETRDRQDAKTRMQRELTTLTPDERRFLNLCYFQHRSTVYVPPTNPLIGSLRGRGILVPGAREGDILAFPFRIDQDVWAMLDEVHKTSPVTLQQRVEYEHTPIPDFLRDVERSARGF